MLEPCDVSRTPYVSKIRNPDFMDIGKLFVKIRRHFCGAAFPEPKAHLRGMCGNRCQHIFGENEGDKHTQ